MKALVAAYQAVLLVDVAAGEVVRVVHEGRDGYYGITWDEGQVYVSALEGQGDQILIFNHDLQHARTVDIPEAKYVHQIVAYGNFLYVVAAGYDLVWLYYLPAVDKARLFGPVNSSKLGTSDLHHLNSVYAKDDYVYTLGHNWEAGSFVALHDRRTLDPVHTYWGVGWLAHNVWPGVDHGLVTLDSFAGKVVSLTKGELANLKGHFEPAYPRGLAATREPRGEGTVLVGVCEYEPVRQRRRSGKSRIFVYDYGFNFKNEWILGDWGGIREIRFTDCEDLCHFQRPRLAA